jgi:hypothetical protein
MLELRYGVTLRAEGVMQQGGWACSNELQVIGSLRSMKKPLRCVLQFHRWRLMTNDEGQQYKTCERCGAYQDFIPVAGASGG